jgi:hypothetical protein
MENSIRDTLLRDTVTFAASSVYNTATYKFVDSSDIPRFMTTCLADLATAAFGRPLADVVIVYTANGNTVPNGITIYPSDGLNPYDAKASDECDAPGAVTSLVCIEVKGVKTKTDALELTRDIGLRIKYILDNESRASISNLFMNSEEYQQITTASDPSILPLECGGRVSIKWVRTYGIHEGSYTSEYLCEYIIRS